MRCGDISNKVAPIIGVYIDCLLETTIKEMGIFHRKHEIRIPNKTGIYTLTRVWRNRDYTFYIYAIAPEREMESIQKDLDNYTTFGRLFVVENLDELRNLLMSQGVLYYVDADPQRISMMTGGGVKGIYLQEVSVTL